MRVSRVVASGVGGFAKANILIYVGLRSASPNLRLMHYFSLAMPLLVCLINSEGLKKFVVRTLVLDLSDKSLTTNLAKLMR